VIGRAARDALAASQKRLHFADRSLPRLAREAPAVARAEGTALAAWLAAGNAISQKRRDAEALLGHLAAGVGPCPTPAFRSEHAEVWRRFRAEADAADGRVAA
jgi:hypothetical protein